MEIEEEEEEENLLLLPTVIYSGSSVCISGHTTPPEPFKVQWTSSSI